MWTYPVLTKIRGLFKPKPKLKWSDVVTNIVGVTPNLASDTITWTEESGTHNESIPAPSRAPFQRHVDTTGVLSVEPGALAIIELTAPVVAVEKVSLKSDPSQSMVAQFNANKGTKLVVIGNSGCNYTLKLVKVYKPDEPFVAEDARELTPDERKALNIGRLYGRDLGGIYGRDLGLCGRE